MARWVADPTFPKSVGAGRPAKRVSGVGLEDLRVEHPKVTLPIRCWPPDVGALGLSKDP